jgi:hypothetical protein
MQQPVIQPTASVPDSISCTALWRENYPDTKRLRRNKPKTPMALNAIGKAAGNGTAVMSIGVISMKR